MFFCFNRVFVLSKNILIAVEGL